LVISFYIAFCVCVLDGILLNCGLCVIAVCTCSAIFDLETQWLYSWASTFDLNKIAVLNATISIWNAAMKLTIVIINFIFCFTVI
jgi:hypothetical protein